MGVSDWLGFCDAPRGCTLSLCLIVTVIFCKFIHCLLNLVYYVVSGHMTFSQLDVLKSRINHIQQFSKMLQHHSKADVTFRPIHVHVIFTHAFHYAILISQEVTSAF